MNRLIFQFNHWSWLKLILRVTVNPYLLVTIAFL
jgi:hypothetical protein